MELQELVAEIRSPIVRVLLDHWLQARGDRVMPRWRDIDATCIPDALPMISVWQVEPPCVIRGRLCGNETRYFYGHNIKGKTIEEVFPPLVAPDVRAMLLDVTTPPTIIHMCAEMPDLRGNAVAYERISLPLSFDGERCDGVISVRDGIGIVPVEQYGRDTVWIREPENRVKLQVEPQPLPG